MLRPHDRSRAGPMPSTRDSLRPKIKLIRPQDAPIRDIDLVTNAYRIESSKKNLKIYEYALVVTISNECNNLPAKVLGRAYVSRSIRKLLMETVVPQLINANQSNLGSVLIDPNLETIYTITKFALEQETSSDNQERKFQDLPVETDLIKNLTVDIKVKFEKSYIAHPDNFTGPLLSSIIHHEPLISMLKYGPVYYMHHQTQQLPIRQPQPRRLDLISQHLMGTSISGGRRSLDGQLIVVINCTHSYITQRFRLIDLLASFIAGEIVEGLPLLHSIQEPIANLATIQIPDILRICGREDWFKSFCDILDGFKCQAVDFHGNHVNLRFSQTDQSAVDLLVDQDLSVRDFYRYHGINLNYPNLPCLRSSSSEHPFYPLEMCSLLPGQKVPSFRLSSAARNHSTTLNKPKPELSKRSSSKARDDIVELNKNQFNTFGIGLSDNPVEATGRSLMRPTLQYRDRRFDPQRDFWESGVFCQSVDLVNNWCIVDTVGLEANQIMAFFEQFSQQSRRFGLSIGQPMLLMQRNKQDMIEDSQVIDDIIRICMQSTQGRLRFVMFIIDSNSTQLNRLIHLTFDEHPIVTATCLRAESIQNQRQHRSIYRTLVHKLNARLGGTNVTYHEHILRQLNLDCKRLMVVGLDVTHPDNELSGVSIVGCAYTFSQDLFRHKSLVWPQAARKEIITNMEVLIQRLLDEYSFENQGQLPVHLIIYRDGVSHEEFDKVQTAEISIALETIAKLSKESKSQKPSLSYIIAQKRHTMRFFRVSPRGDIDNPPGGTLINQGTVASNEREFYLYSNTNPQNTARPLHYHVLLNNLGMDNLQKLTYYLCFNFGKCSSSLSMPSSLRYAHNAAYDARNRVIAAREFLENRFYTTKFFC